MIALLNRITGGELLLWKVIVSTVVFGLAGVQVVLAARFWKVSAFPAIKPGTASRAHRWVGRAALLGAVVVGLSCLAGPAGPTSPTRVLLHSVFGPLAFGLLAVKFLLLRVLRKGSRYLPVVGSAVFLTFGAIWATSVADYVAR